MIEQKYEDIFNEEEAKDAVLNTEYHGFREDYLTLHCLLRKYKPKRILEIGCNMGTGTKIIKNALPGADVYSLDLPTELAHISLQHPISEGKGDRVGINCNLPFTLLRGDSMKYDYSTLYPLECWYIDGEHDYEHPLHEAKEAIKSGASLIIFHDSDIPEVGKAIENAFQNQEYNVYRVMPTRIAYALKIN